MALIQCSECGKEISDKADACPACGNPTHKHVAGGEEKIQKVEIEATNKKWKGTGCFATVLGVIGVMLLSKSVGLGIMVIFIAFLISFYTRIGAWWDNG